MIEVKVTVETVGADRKRTGMTIYAVLVPGEDTDDGARKCRNVINAAVEMGAALLDAEYSKTP